MESTHSKGHRAGNGRPTEQLPTRRSQAEGGQQSLQRGRWQLHNGHMVGRDWSLERLALAPLRPEEPVDWVAEWEAARGPALRHQSFRSSSDAAMQASSAPIGTATSVKQRSALFS